MEDVSEGLGTKGPRQEAGAIKLQKRSSYSCHPIEVEVRPLRVKQKAPWTPT